MRSLYRLFRVYTEEKEYRIKHKLDFFQHTDKAIEIVKKKQKRNKNKLLYESWCPRINDRDDFC